MLEEFLNKLAAVTGKKYTPAEFGKLIKEAEAAAEKQSSKSAKTEDQKTDSKKKQ